MNNILPFILESLSNKPLSGDTEKNLIKDLRLRYKIENLNSRHLKEDFDQAIEIGEDLGIFRLAGENVSLPFTLQNKKKQLVSKSSTSSVPETISKTNKMAVTDKVRRPRRRSSRSSHRRQSGSRSRSRGRGSSQRRRRSSRR